MAKISEEVRPVILLNDEVLDDDVLSRVIKLNLHGIEVKDGNIYAYPKKIVDRENVAFELSKILDVTPTKLEQVLKGKNRYVVLKKKVPPEVSAKIKQIMQNDKSKNFFGIGLQDEYYRYYPENELAANVLGFVTPKGVGRYGIEERFNSQLQGKKGVFQTQRDGSVYGRQITVGDSVIQQAEDGDDIVLTIDRSMEMAIEKILERGVKKYQADSGQAVVMDPKTGYVLAMAHYPSFNPNSYGDALKLEEIDFSPEEIEKLEPIKGEPDAFWFYRNRDAHDRFKVFRKPVDKKYEKGEEIVYKYYKYANLIGFEAYKNKVVSDPYEPGSVFKIITMSSAMDDRTVTPQTSFNDPGELKVDWNPAKNDYDYTITNVSKKCTGYVNMINVIEYSCNTGVGWVAKKMGANLFYSYIKRFGFGERTGIEFDNEQPGTIEHFSKWVESELVTHAFGQGLTVTPIQMVTAYAAIANGGILLQPHIVDSIVKENGSVIKTEVNVVHRVISEDVAKKATAMLVSAVENGVSNGAVVEHHYIAAKTGTSQTYKNGKALKGAGTTIASIAGFGPIDDPKFVLYVKLDRPRTSEWSGNTAAHVFSEIATYLYDYLGIPPDKD